MLIRKVKEHTWLSGVKGCQAHTLCYFSFNTPKNVLPSIKLNLLPCGFLQTFMNFHQVRIVFAVIFHAFYEFKCHVSLTSLFISPVILFLYYVYRSKSKRRFVNDSSVVSAAILNLLQNEPIPMLKFCFHSN